MFDKYFCFLSLASAIAHAVAILETLSPVSSQAPHISDAEPRMPFFRALCIIAKPKKIGRYIDFVHDKSMWCTGEQTWTQWCVDAHEFQEQSLFWCGPGEVCDQFDLNTGRSIDQIDIKPNQLVWVRCVTPDSKQEHIKMGKRILVEQTVFEPVFIPRRKRSSLKLSIKGNTVDTPVDLTWSSGPLNDSQKNVLGTKRIKVGTEEPEDWVEFDYGFDTSSSEGEWVSSEVTTGSHVSTFVINSFISWSPPPSPKPPGVDSPFNESMRMPSPEDLAYARQFLSAPKSSAGGTAASGV